MEFTSKIISIIAKSATLGIPLEAVEPLLLGSGRLAWLGHLLPDQVVQFSQIGADLSMANDSFLATIGSTLATSSLLYVLLRCTGVNLILGVIFRQKSDQHRS